MTIHIILTDKERCGFRFEKEKQPQVIWCDKSNDGWMKEISENEIRKFPIINRLFLSALKLLWDILCKGGNT